MLTMKSIEDNIFVIKSCSRWGVSGPTDPTDINEPSPRYARDGLDYHKANEQCKRVRAENGAVLILERRGYELDGLDMLDISCFAHSMSTLGLNWRQFAHNVASRWEDRNDC